jgi:hypothetical protein
MICDDTIPCFIETNRPSAITLKDIYHAQFQENTCLQLKEDIKKGIYKFYIHNEIDSTAVPTIYGPMSYNNLGIRDSEEMIHASGTLSCRNRTPRWAKDVLNSRARILLA